ncbi:MAG TPA: tRNA uridine-5-carboxymethylaminomethyl(34) synthesis GTPase MnmE, partial [Bacteroidia bacterium]|nr:tRNA uridine-5-carboxymethylaminomethyl(34) synthesis GTPase MnmE [Bacteroidia bacterium]
TASVPPEVYISRQPLVVKIFQLLKNYEVFKYLFLHGMEEGISNDLLSTHIRDAIYSLGEITGQVSTEDLLDYIFSQFCIGK